MPFRSPSHGIQWCLDGPEANSFFFKVLVVGDSSVGKTSLIERKTKGRISKYYRATIGSDFSTVQTVVDGVDVTLQLWDLAGQDRVRQSTLTTIYTRDSCGCVLVYEIGNLNSLQGMLHWKEVIDQVLIDRGRSSLFPFVLAANKHDLWEISGEEEKELDRICRDHNISGWMLTSAKTGENVSNLFDQIAKAMKNVHQGLPPILTVNQLQLTFPKPVPKKSILNSWCSIL